MAGLKVDEDFTRHSADGRFVEITEIGVDTDLLASTIADCLLQEQSGSWNPEETGAYDLLFYSITELANNVLQHSRGKGYCFVQKYPKKNYLRIAIADDGIGIKNSLIDTPYFKEKAVEAIAEAIKPRVSGSTHKTIGESVNFGVGLAILTKLSSLLGGYFSIYSDDGLYSSHGATTVRSPIQGTICGFCFPLDALDGKSFNTTVLQRSKKELGLLTDNNFSGVFI